MSPEDGGLVWVDVGPEFGAGMPYGSCNALVDVAIGKVCGYPRRRDGSCVNGHPAPPVPIDPVEEVRLLHERAILDVDRAARFVNLLVLHTADWQYSEDPEKRQLFQATHDLLGALGSIRMGIGLAITYGNDNGNGNGDGEGSGS